MFRICLPKQDLELIKFLRVSGNNCCHGNAFKIFGSQTLVVFHSLNSCMDFLQIVRISLPQEGLELIWVLGISDNSSCMAILLDFLGFKLCGCSTA